MGLRDDVADAYSSRKFIGRPGTKRWEVRERLGEADAAEFEELLADPRVRPIDIWTALDRKSIDVSKSSVIEWCRAARAERQ